MIDLSKAPQQRQEYYRPSEKESDPVQAFLSEMAGYGLKPGSVDPSGSLVRFDVKKRGDKAGWYVFYTGDICAGSFGNWQQDLKVSWCSKQKSEMSEEERERYQERVDAIKRQRQAEQERVHAEKRELANQIYNGSESATVHPYLEKKNVKAYGLRTNRGDLVIPAYDKDGIIHSLQFIKPNGEKKFLGGGRIEGCSFTIPGNEQLFICEGYATGATIHEATGGTVICCFNIGNMIHVAREVRAVCQGHEIVICADNDRNTPGKIGRASCRERVS
jgi:putative DNA primase/helicase